MPKKTERFFCPRCRQVTADVVAVGGSTFCASCLAGIESLIVAHVPPVDAAGPTTATLVDEPQD